MGRNARIGLFLLMGLIVALARLIEVEVGKAKPQEEARPQPSLLVQHAPRPATVHQRKTHRAAPLEHARSAPPTAPALAVATPVEKEAKDDGEGAEWPKGPIYVVKKGETLGAIALKVLGSSRLAHKLLEANASRIPNPNAMKPGTRLVVPR